MQWVTALKQPSRAVDQRPSSANITNEQSYISAPPLCLHGMLWGDLYLYEMNNDGKILAPKCLCYLKQLLQ